MTEISICIPTYKRPILLEKLLTSLIQCNHSGIEVINLIIVDNDMSMSAKPIVEKIGNILVSKFRLLYSICKEKGLSNVRNNLLEQAYQTKSEFIIFIDDDEFVSKNWLTELLKSIEINDCIAVRGPVVAVMPPNISKYIACWFEREKYTNGSKIKTLTTGNLILNRKTVESLNVWFDQRFNDSGSEDCFFGTQILKRGLIIIWCSEAIVYEMIPETRAKLQWILKRYLRTAGTYTFILKIEKDYVLLLKKFLISILYIILGVISIPLLITSYKKKYWGLIKISEGIGALIEFVNLPFKEYS